MLKHLRLGTLRQRIAVIILANAVLLIGIIAFLIVLNARVGDRVYLLPDPKRVAAIVEAFEKVPPDSYHGLAYALSDERSVVRVLARLPYTPSIAPATAAARLRAGEFNRALGGRPIRILRDGNDVLGHLDEQPLLSPRPFRVVVGLPDGRAVEVLRSVIPPAARLFLNMYYVIGALFLYNFLVIFLVAAQSTIPVERLIKAVRSDDPNTFVIRGPPEFVELGTAFREMRDRLHALLEERTRIIAAVAHDFRTYLTRLELRADFIDDPEEQALARQDLAEMKELMQDALTFARPAGNAPDEDAVIDVIGELRTILYARRRSGQDVSLAHPSVKCLACATPVAFRRMIDNLLDNSHRYGRGKTMIAVEQREEQVLLSIEDDGPGVPPSRLDDLTEPFLRLETSRSRHTGGAGLGLSIVVALAHRFDGNLELRNRAEGGLSALLTLRAADLPSHSA